MLARLGGDEFLVLLTDLEPDGGRGGARAAADEVAARLAEPFKVAGAEFHVQASVGISLFPDDAEAPDELLQHADMAMYQSKGRGRAASTVYAQVDPRPARAAVAARAAAARDRRATSSSCTTSRSCGLPAAGSPRWRRCCAGTTPTAGSSTPTTSSPPPRR